jgi:hypothetical protein
MAMRRSLRRSSSIRKRAADITAIGSSTQFSEDAAGISGYLR